MKKIIVLLLIATLAMVLFTGCRNQNDTPEPPPAQTGQQAQQPTGGGTTVADPTPAEPTANGEIVDGFFRFYDTVTIPALMAHNPDSITAGTRMWLQEWASRYMNIEFDINWVLEDEFGVQFPAFMAAGNYPPVILYPHREFPEAHRIRFGEIERIFIPLEDYFFDPELMPNKSYYLEQAGDQVNVLRSLSGHLFSAVTFGGPLYYATGAGYMHMFMDSRVAYAVGFADTYGKGSRIPDNTDELLEFLRLVKELDPNNLGVNNNPLGGGINNHPFGMLLNAFGFLGSLSVHGDHHTALTSVVGGSFIPGSNWGAPQHLGDVVGMQTHPNFFEYLQFVHTLYSEGLICPEFFTLDGPTVIARAGADYNAIVTNWNTGPLHEDSWPYYNIIRPMTSPVNPHRMLTSGTADMWNTSMFFVTHIASDLEIEATMRFLDVLYYRGDPNDRRTGMAHRAHSGPYYNWNEDTFGIVDQGFFWGHMDADTNERVFNDDPHNIRDSRHGSMDVFHETWNPNAQFHNWAAYGAHISWLGAGGGGLNRIEQRFFDALDINMRGQWGTYMAATQMRPYNTRNKPGALFPEDVQNRMIDLRMVLQDHTRVETARFITGQRPITAAEFEAYGNELRALGYDEYVAAIQENMAQRFPR